MFPLYSSTEAIRAPYSSRKPELSECVSKQQLKTRTLPRLQEMLLCLRKCLGSYRMFWKNWTRPRRLLCQHKAQVSDLVSFKPNPLRQTSNRTSWCRFITTTATQRASALSWTVLNTSFLSVVIYVVNVVLLLGTDNIGRPQDGYLMLLTVGLE